MPSSVAAELASLDLSTSLLAAERVADRRLSGVRGGEWSCARFDVPPTGAAKTHLMAALADDVSAALERHTGAPAFLAYGTLLGALRERDLLEWSGALRSASVRRWRCRCRVVTRQAVPAPPSVPFSDSSRSVALAAAEAGAQ